MFFFYHRLLHEIVYFIPGNSKKDFVLCVSFKLNECVLRWRCSNCWYFGRWRCDFCVFFFCKCDRVCELICKCVILFRPACDNFLFCFLNDFTLTLFEYVSLYGFLHRNLIVAVALLLILMFKFLIYSFKLTINCCAIVESSLLLCSDNLNASHLLLMLY